MGGNGAGKTTLLKLAAGLLQPELGDVRLDKALRVGYLGHELGLYEDLSVNENIGFYARLRGVNPRNVRCDLDPILRVAALSRGMKERLALCCATLHDPDILLLDEPTSGLDAEAAPRVRMLFGDKTVLVATHDKDLISGMTTFRL